MPTAIEKSKESGNNSSTSNIQAVTMDEIVIDNLDENDYTEANNQLIAKGQKIFS